MATPSRAGGGFRGTPQRNARRGTYRTTPRYPRPRNPIADEEIKFYGVRSYLLGVYPTWYVLLNISIHHAIDSMAIGSLLVKLGKNSETLTGHGTSSYSVPLKKPLPT
jgi:hypothetical protein